MNGKYESSTCIIDNLYAFLGWVVSYSDYGKEFTVDTILRRFKLIEKIDESMAFENKKQYDEYIEVVEKCRHDTSLENNINIILNAEEVEMCEELKKDFTHRFRRAKQFTDEQIAEYKARKILKKEGSMKLNDPIQPIKLIDHERKKVVCVVYSPEVAAKMIGANKSKLRESIDKKSFYKGYLWVYCSVEEYNEYDKRFSEYAECRKKSKKG